MTPSSDTLAGRFVAALHDLESRGEIARLTAMFDDDATLESLSRTDQGPDAAHRFWSRYRSQFDTIHSTFSRTIVTDDAIVLLWRSEGRLKGGRPIAYGGASILSCNDGRITRFETFYDSAAFAPLVAKASQTA